MEKQNRLPFSNSTTTSNAYFGIVHMDIWDPISTTFMLGHKYFLTIVDDHNKFCWIFLMKLKFETSSLIQSFVHFTQSHFQKTIWVIKYENGLELTMKLFLPKTWDHSSKLLPRYPHSTISFG